MDSPHLPMRQQLQLRTQHPEHRDRNGLLKRTVGQVELHAPVIGRHTADLNARYTMRAT